MSEGNEHPRLPSTPFSLALAVINLRDECDSYAAAAGVVLFFGVLSFLGVAAAFFLGAAAFFAAGLEAALALVLVTRPDFVLPRTFFSSTTAGA